MNEIYSRAIVLDRKEIGEADCLVSLFTEEYGKIVAHAKSIKKISSKLSAHFQPLLFVKARFLRRPKLKDGFMLIDGITDDFSSVNSTQKKHELLPMIRFIDKYVFDLQKDDVLWHFLIDVFSNNYDYREASYILLKIFGISNGKDMCSMCGGLDIDSFHIVEEKFICKNCSSKFSKDDILCISKKSDLIYK